MHIGPQGGMFKVWVHAWERRFHVRILRCTESEVNALAGPCISLPTRLSLQATSYVQRLRYGNQQSHVSESQLSWEPATSALFLLRYCLGVSFSITSSRLKLAGFCRVGNSLKLDSHSADHRLRRHHEVEAASANHLSYYKLVSPRSNGSARRWNSFGMRRFANSSRQTSRPVCAVRGRRSSTY